MKKTIDKYYIKEFDYYTLCEDCLRKKCNDPTGEIIKIYNKKSANGLIRESFFQEDNINKNADTIKFANEEIKKARSVFRRHGYVYLCNDYQESGLFVFKRLKKNDDSKCSCCGYV